MQQLERNLAINRILMHAKGLMKQANWPGHLLPNIFQIESSMFFFYLLWNCTCLLGVKVYKLATRCLVCTTSVRFCVVRKPSLVLEPCVRRHCGCWRGRGAGGRREYKEITMWACCLPRSVINGSKPNIFLQRLKPFAWQSGNTLGYTCHQFH